MILDRITVFQFRCYAGAHEFDLTPRKKYGYERPIVLFGGLNGAGKTTLLLAVKLALYGRQALGTGTRKSAYEQFIRSSIHREPDLLIEPNHTYVDLELTYGKLGERIELSIRREWLSERKGVKESLTIAQNGRRLDSLTDEECQGFLNELIPPGVADLFFFDGEKIADLAEDDSGTALGDAIGRLLGLDLVERLRNDLRVFQLRTASRSSGLDSSALDELQIEYEESNKQLSLGRHDLNDAVEKLRALEVVKEQIEGELLERGGDWGISRQKKQQKSVKLAEQVRQSERELQEMLTGVYPLTLAGDLLKDLVNELTREVDAQSTAQSNEILNAFAEAIKDKLSATITDREVAAIDETLASRIQPTLERPPLLDITSRDLGTIEKTIKVDARKAVKRVKSVSKSIGTIIEELDQISLQIERAPDESTLVEKINALGKVNDQIVDLRADIAVRTRDLESEYQQVIQQARTLKREHEASNEIVGFDKPMEYATKMRALLKEFSVHNAREKVKRLELEFVESFQRLSRKNDLFTQAAIDPIRFTVTLLGSQGETIERSELSAGEKQIYAIAMLEALSRTSGRKLPILVDTPLGRLDSEHRQSLVENYFPQASHQVIVLSTDTEVDQDFYQSLSSHISHAFEIRFDEAVQATEVSEGYFWRKQLRAAV